MTTALEALTDILGAKKARDVVDELWGLGFTFVRRPADPYHMPAESIPRGRVYEWAPKTSSRQRVPAFRHDGVFAPSGHAGDVEIGGLVLVEFDKAEADQAIIAAQRAVDKQVSDWVERCGSAGFVGGVRELQAVRDGDFKTVRFAKVGPDGPLAGAGTTLISQTELMAERNALLARGFAESDDETTELAIHIVKGRKIHRASEILMRRMEISQCMEISQ